ncbi:MAG: hypothetical protein AAB728_04645 [Patescibacteria group bacterium]
MDKERRALGKLEQEPLSHLKVVAQNLSQEALNGGLSRGQSKYRRRVTQVLHRKTTEQDQWKERDIQRQLNPPLSVQARYDKGYDMGRDDDAEWSYDRSDECSDPWERRGYREGYCGCGRRRIRE